jgi:murein peptide amidase A
MSNSKDAINLTDYFRELNELFENAKFSGETIITTPAGPVDVWTRRYSTEAPTVYLSAGMHGDEPAGPLAILALLRRKELAPVNWIICPMLNPTGCAAYSRENDRGTDQNRDYYERSSIEIFHHAAWWERQSSMPDLFVSLHEDWETSGFYFYEINLGEDQPAMARAILDAVSSILPIEPELIVDDHQVREAGWIYHEAKADLPDLWPEAIFLAKLGCPLSFTLETPSLASKLDQRVMAHLAAIDVVISCTIRGN